MMPTPTTATLLRQAQALYGAGEFDTACELVAQAYCHHLACQTAHSIARHLEWAVAVAVGFAALLVTMHQRCPQPQVAQAVEQLRVAFVLATDREGGQIKEVGR